ncbi:MAG: macro domain-containing protein [Candidatus Kaelpia aquatica]|nr:macro domain-containing protein [Candidatus Kaelpia aquatica]
MKINNLEIEFRNEDITTLRVDAIINPANTELVMGGGLALTIKRKAGNEIEREALRLAPIGLGDSVVTSGGRLKSDWVIHSATMKMDFKTDQDIIRRSFNSALNLAKERSFKSIAVPALGCGTGGFPLKKAAKIMVNEILSHTQKCSSLKRIIFSFKTKSAYVEFKESFLSYYGYQLRKLAQIPIPTADAIILIEGSKILLIERENSPYGLALPGGFLEYGESLEDCIRREVQEETSLRVVELRQFYTYSAAERDPRFHTVTTVFIVEAEGLPKAGSDAKAIKQCLLDEIPPKEDFAFDHWQILQDWLKTQ